MTQVIPWRRRAPGLRTDFDYFDALFDPLFRTQFTTQLPEAFRNVPPVNLAEDEKCFRASIELPGMEEKDIEISILGHQLVISGERKWEQEKKEKDYYRVESQYGQFRRAIDLPEGLRTDSDAVNATYKKGILEIEIPKVEPKPAAKVKIKNK
jgi:HSP20 family protein